MIGIFSYLVSPLMDLDLNNIIKVQKLTDDQVRRKRQKTTKIPGKRQTRNLPTATVLEFVVSTQSHPCLNQIDSEMCDLVD